MEGGWKGGRRKEPRTFGQSAANETIQLNSANSERSHVPTRWQGAAGWAGLAPHRPPSSWQTVQLPGTCEGFVARRMTRNRGEGPFDRQATPSSERFKQTVALAT